MTRKLIVLALMLLALAACAKEERATDNPAAAAAMEEKTYPLKGRIVSRDPATNQLTVDHEEIPGYMAAMTMPYEVKGQNVAELPADGTEIDATVHATEEAYWLTDVKAAQDTPATATDTTGTVTSTSPNPTDSTGTSTVN